MSKAKAGRNVRLGGVAVLLLAGVVLFVLWLPAVVCNTGLRSTAMNQALGKLRMAGTCRRMQLGWWTPLTLEQLELTTRNGTTVCEVESLRSSVTLWQLLRGDRQLGTFYVDGSTVTLFVGEGAATWDLLRGAEGSAIGDGDSPLAEPAPASKDTRVPTEWSMQLRDCRLVVYEYTERQLLADVPGVNLDVEVGSREGAEWLTVAIQKPLRELPVTPQLVEVGLKYVAPVLAVATETQGRVSLRVDHCEVPLHEPELAEVRGQVTLHDVSAGLRTGTLQSATRDLAALSGRALPDKIRLAHENRIDFVVANRRIQHRGMAIGLPSVSPDLVVRSAGSVGFDESLDLQLEVPLPFGLLGKGMLAQALGNQMLKVPIKGTLQQPKAQFEGDGNLVSGLIAGLLRDDTSTQQVGAEDLPTPPPSSDEGGPEPSLPEGDAVSEILEQAGDVADVIRQRLQQRREERAVNPPRRGRRLRNLFDRFRRVPPPDAEEPIAVPPDGLEP